MAIHFATCERTSALGFLQRVYPGSAITDTPDCAKPLLDFVEADVVRIQDPMMHGNRIQVVPGTHWTEDARDGVVAAAMLIDPQGKP